MPVYHVTVTASYPPTIPSEMHQNLNEWVSAGHDRVLSGSIEFEPRLLVATAIYRISATSEDRAERAAYERFAAESVDAGIAGPETVIAEVTRDD